MRVAISKTRRLLPAIAVCGFVGTTVLLCTLHGGNGSAPAVASGGASATTSRTTLASPADALSPDSQGEHPRTRPLPSRCMPGDSHGHAAATGRGSAARVASAHRQHTATAQLAQSDAMPHPTHCPSPRSVRFVILSKQHSGTHFLRNALHQPHAGATVFDELFWPSVKFCNASGASLHAKLDTLFGFLPFDDDEDVAHTHGGCVRTRHLKRWLVDNEQLLASRYGDVVPGSGSVDEMTNPPTNRLFTRFLQNQDYTGFIWMCPMWGMRNSEITKDGSSPYLERWHASFVSENATTLDSHSQKVYRDSSALCGGTRSLAAEHLEYLKTRNVRVVLLERTNEIATSLASDATLSIDNKRRLRADTSNISRVTIDIPKLEANARHRQTMFARTRAALDSAGIPALHVTYEALSKNHSSFVDVLRFLGLQNVSIANEHTLVTPHWSFSISDASKHHKQRPAEYIDNVPAVIEQLPAMRHIKECMLWDTCKLTPI